MCIWTASKNAMAISWFHHTAVMIGFEHCFLGGPLCNRREDHEEFLHKVIFDIIADELYKLDLVKKKKNGAAPSHKQNVFLGKGSTAYFFFHVYFSKKHYVLIIAVTIMSRNIRNL